MVPSKWKKNCFYYGIILLLHAQHSLGLGILNTTNTFL